MLKRGRPQPEHRMPGEPTKTDRWLAWRSTRSNTIAKPTRNAAAQKLNGSQERKP